MQIKWARYINLETNYSVVPTGKYPLAQIWHHFCPSFPVWIQTFYEMFPVHSGTHLLIQYFSFGWGWEIHLFNQVFSIHLLSIFSVMVTELAIGNAMMKILIGLWFSSKKKWSLKSNIQQLTVVQCGGGLWQRLNCHQASIPPFSLLKSHSANVLFNNLGIPYTDGFSLRKFIKRYIYSMKMKIKF